MRKEVIILAGGLGTRLRSAVADVPKCMAPVKGRPFIAYLIEYFQHQGVNRFIFALGYKSEYFEKFLSGILSPDQYLLSIEKEPLGTGGAIRLACQAATQSQVLVANGDTLFKIDLNGLSAFHTQHQADCTLSLKPMSRFDRYGIVELSDTQAIRSFREKQYYEQGLINGGVYALEVGHFLRLELPEKFSFEKEYLEKYYASYPMFGWIQDRYFIDIGIPADYQRAQLEL